MLIHYKYINFAIINAKLCFMAPFKKSRVFNIGKGIGITEFLVYCV